MAYKDKEKQKAYDKDKYASNREKRLLQMREYKRLNKGSISEYNKDYHESHYNNNREHILERVRIYREANKEKIKAQKKEYRQKNREAIAKSGKKYRKENIDKIRNRVRVYIKNNPDKFTCLPLRKQVSFVLKPVILERDNYSCILCGSHTKLKCHHIKPVNVCSNEEIIDCNNLVTLCSTCHKLSHGGSYRKLIDEQIAVKLKQYIEEIKVKNGKG